MDTSSRRRGIYTRCQFQKHRCAPDTPLIEFASPGASSQGLIDNFLELNPLSLSVLDYRDSQLDASLSSKTVRKDTKKSDTKTPPPKDTSKSFPRGKGKC